MKYTVQSNSVKYLYTVNIHYNIVNQQFELKIRLTMDGEEVVLICCGGIAAPQEFILYSESLELCSSRTDLSTTTTL